MEIYPSLISSDILNLEKTICLLDLHCHGYHIDVMDNHFVPNLTWGPMFTNAIAKVTSLPLHVHLMVDDPVRWVEKLTIRKQDIFIFHYEVFTTIEAIEGLIKKVKTKGWKVGIAINPKTEVTVLSPLLSKCDHVLLMSVEPGFSGKRFIDSVIEKISPLVTIKKDKDFSFTIGMDGGIGSDNLAKLSQLGVEQFGVASAIFSSDDPVAALKNLYRFGT